MGCWLTQINLYNGHETVVVVVLLPIKNIQLKFYAVKLELDTSRLSNTVMVLKEIFLSVKETSILSVDYIVSELNVCNY